jgi:hypothetical protein
LGRIAATYTSAEQTITAAGLVQLTHGLGGVPDAVEYRLVCKTAQANYAVNDVVVVSVNSTANGADCFSSPLVTSTNIDIRYNVSAAVFYLQNKTTGAATALTPANWRLVVKAVRYL